MDENQEEDNEQDDDEELEEFPFNFSDQKTKEDSVSDGAVVPRGRCSSEGCLEACLVLLACTMLGEWCTFADFLRVPTSALFFSLVKKPMGANPCKMLRLKELPPNRQSLFDLEDDASCRDHCDL